MSSSAMMHFYLALVYQRTARVPDAKNEFQSALKLDPNNFPANLLLGRLFVVEEKPAAALPFLLKAAKLRPDAIDAHRFLAQVYGQLGKQDTASRELKEAERIRSQGGSRLGTPTEDEGSAQQN
jgi:predicted Zn-dependent protease